jgi:Zinc finger, C2H2 type
VCPQCSKAFKNSKQLKNHRRNHRLAEQTSLSCPTCGLKFISPVAMDAHIEKVHMTASAVLKWTCQACDVKFEKHAELRLHAREHAEPKRYGCPDCEYVTNDHNAFRRHKMTHSHQPKYKCPMCDYTCIQSTTYRVSIRRKYQQFCKCFIFELSRITCKSGTPTRPTT